MLQDSDLGNMVDLVVDLVVGLVTDLVNNRCCGNVVSSRGNSNCGSRGNMVVGHRSNSNSGGSSLYLDSLGSSNSWSSMGDRVNKAILVDIFREPL